MFKNKTTKTVFIILIVVALLSTIFLFQNQQPKTPDLKTVNIDLTKYAGTWYSIKEIPSYLGFYPFGYDSKQFVNETATYTLNTDGTIKVVNNAYINGKLNTITGTARVVGVGKLEVSFFPFIYAPYQIIGIDPNYQWAIVGSPNHQNLWYLSRTPTLTTEQITQLNQIATQNGFDITKMVNVKQGA